MELWKEKWENLRINLMNHLKNRGEEMLLVTGITGLTGRFLYKELKQKITNIDVKYLVRNTSDIAWIEDENLVKGDLKDLKNIENIFKGVTTVLHLAPRGELKKCIRCL